MPTKQAISPNGLKNQSAEGHSGVSSEQPISDLPDEQLPNQKLRYKYTDGSDEPGENVRIMNPNRSPNNKPNIDKPACD